MRTSPGSALRGHSSWGDVGSDFMPAVCGHTDTLYPVGVGSMEMI